LPPAARAALNSSQVAAHHPRLAFDPARPERVAEGPAGKPRVLYPGIRESP
jgi:hypothetical protein